jgi:hypothetical protein
VSIDRLVAGVFLVVISSLALWSALAGTPSSDVSLLPCPVYTLTDVRCPGCGITRACVALVRGQFHSAWDRHPFAYFLVPLALAVLLAPTRLRIAWRALPAQARQFTSLVLLALCLGLWAWRLL